MNAYNFMEPDRLSYGRVSELAGPALVRPLRKYGEWFLLTAGETPVAIALSGGEAGWFMRIEDGEHHEGLCIRDVSIEVDIGSAFPATVVQRPVLSVIRHKAGLALVGRPDRGSYGRAPFIRWSGDASPDEQGAVGFAN